MHIVFILNYFCGSRVGELLTLTVRSIDQILNIIKFRVKDTLTRDATTKVLPIHQYVGQALVEYLTCREKVLKEIEYMDFPHLLFKIVGGKPFQLSNSDINEYYRDLAMALEIPIFTTHMIRYQSQTDLTEHGYSFIHTNIILSHYFYKDEIFSTTSEISFEDFRKSYCNILDELLRELR